jgi:hypothetical protein
MEPNATYRSFLESLELGDLASAEGFAGKLMEGLDRGGDMPRGWFSRGSLRTYLEFEFRTARWSGMS